ncbi:MAG: response regulator, partial [Gammaproteobacteria bacterium]
RQRILVVDDQQDHRQLLLSLLEPLGFYLAEACSGEECLIKVEEKEPDLVLLDLSMTGISGAETAVQLRQRGFSHPIVVLSANAYPTDRLAAINAGCNDFIAKPIQIQELYSKLKMHLELDWICQPFPVPETTEFRHPPIQLPPQQIIDRLAEYVRIGDLFGLKNQLDEVGLNDSEFQPFVMKIRQLASEFRVAEIKHLLRLDIKNNLHT